MCCPGAKMPPPDEGLLGFSGARRVGARKPSDWERQGS